MIESTDEAKALRDKIMRERAMARIRALHEDLRTPELQAELCRVRSPFPAIALGVLIFAVSAGGGLLLLPVVGWRGVLGIILLMWANNLSRGGRRC